MQCDRTICTIHVTTSNRCIHGFKFMLIIVHDIITARMLLGRLRAYAP